MPKSLLTSISSKKDFSGRLLHWFADHGRDLPWRQNRSPYTTLVAEFMLQQTQATTVIPYFNRFLSRFPNFNALAAATEADVLSAWSGLGYYRRGINLKRCAEILTTAGKPLPSDLGKLGSLPGIGDYTAGAVASMAFNKPVMALDGNVKRLFCRLQALPWPKKKQELRLVQDSADAIAALASKPIAEACIELGATVCQVSQPNCTKCPLPAYCLAFQTNCQSKFGKRKQRTQYLKRSGYVALITNQQDELWIQPETDLPVKSPGLFYLPTCMHTDEKKATELLAEETGFNLENPMEIGSFSHSITKYRFQFSLLHFSSLHPPNNENGRFIDLEGINSLPASAILLKALKLKEKHPAN